MGKKKKNKSGNQAQKNLGGTGGTDTKTHKPAPLKGKAGNKK